MLPNTRAFIYFHTLIISDLVAPQYHPPQKYSNNANDKKRKREEEQAWKKMIKRRTQEEEERITIEEEKAFQMNRELYSLFNDLQGISHE
jgi:hypothetical protein